MRYYTVEVKEKTWEELEKISEIKKLTPDQLIGNYIEKGVREDYLANIVND
jgi:predicted DNA-binding ribbon-helix-helix protein